MSAETVRYAHLALDCYNLTEHAQLVMRDLGITYKFAVPKSTTDQWWFFCCENVPDVLPDCLKPLTFSRRYWVGHGLSDGDMRDVEAWEAAHGVR